MKALIIAFSALVSTTVIAATVPVRAYAGPSGSVVQVNVNGAHAGSGVVIDRKGSILTASYVAEMCEERPCDILVTDGAAGSKPSKAKLAAIDYQAGLAVIVAEKGFDSAVALEDLDKIDPAKPVAVIGVHRKDGKEPQFSAIVEVRLTGPSTGFPCANCLVTDYPGGQSMGGAGVFSVPGGRLAGILFTGHRIDKDDVIRNCSLAIPADTIRRFLQAKGIAFEDAKPKPKTK